MNSSRPTQMGFGFDDGLPPATSLPVARPPRRPTRLTTTTLAPTGEASAVTLSAAPSELSDAVLTPQEALLAETPIPPVLLTPPQAAPRAFELPVTAPVVSKTAPAPDVPGVQLTSAALADADARAMAAALEKHPDFRVLRRLQPQLVFPGAATGPVLRVVVLDTETTGLNPQRDRVIELALLRFDVDMNTGLPVGAVEVYDGLEDPGEPLSAEVQALTGITDDMLRGQRMDEARIAELLQGADLVIAHNAGFDRPFVEARWPAFAELDWACSFADIDWKTEGRGSAKLTTLAMELGLFYDAHRAEMDCHALLAVLMPPLPVSGQRGLLRLAHSASAPSYRLQATGAPFDAKDALKARGYRWDGTAKVWHTRLADQAALALEAEWLKAEVYGARAARVQVEHLTAKQKYASRPGTVSMRQL